MQEKNKKNGLLPELRKKQRLLNGMILLCLFIVIGGLLAARYILDHSYNPHSKSVVERDGSLIPDYSGDGAIVLEDSVPGFNAYDLENIKGEKYSELDSIGRCGRAMALLDRSMMPTGERGSIGQIKPSGWVQKKYPGLVDSEPPYLYNRCHLIAYGLTGQNANEKNLITGTRYMNATLMLPYEETVMKYLGKSGNHVMYRVTPYFKDKELVARGVELEAYSVEDEGESLSFHVFVYNVQPGVEIDYLTGESKASSVVSSFFRAFPALEPQ